MAPSWAPGGPDDTGEQPGPSLDDRPGLGGVTESRRRDTIVSLVNERSETPYTVGELTVALSEWFQDETDGMVPTDEEIHSVLFDFDLPRLDADGRLVFHRETGRVFSPTHDGAHATRASSELNAGSTVDNAGDTNRGSVAPEPTDDRVMVSRKRLVNVAVILVGVAGVAVTASSVSPLDTSFALVPAALVVLFFGYRALTEE
ncbi:uncharacterized protein HfgLR_23430 (plasmid) [Haloferax gibbonsii]|uniref:Uncharacterized protein n=1 Tax=Haloferax gibbonsii TaxID=35746 RepID=A0A871BL80_HALGI|nr:hypothetical protein [Haloferax gibbonsii]QOS13871.1 uncharacterized protein HfgLR_23430 [Haloferax gibbonsii]